MVEGNLARIPIPSVRLYLGVYPNDTGTRDVAMALAKRHPDRVRVIVNTLAGPTSKGQMLNEMFRQVYSSAERPEMVVLHDSEDIIDPRTFEIYARYARTARFHPGAGVSRSIPPGARWSRPPIWTNSRSATRGR